MAVPYAPVSQIISTASKLSSGSCKSPSIPVKRTAAVTVGSVDSVILARMVKAYGDGEFSCVRADSFSFAGGAFSFLGGILGALTPSQTRTGSPPKSSSGWKDEERLAQARACCPNGRWGSARGCEPKSNSWRMVPNAELALSVTSFQVVVDGTLMEIDWPVFMMFFPLQPGLGQLERELS